MLSPSPLSYLLILSLLLLLVSCQGFTGIVTTNVTFEGSIGPCSILKCPTPGFLVPEYDCTNSTTWSNGERFFMDPIPTNLRAEAFNITLHLSTGCTPYTSLNGLVSIDGGIVDFIPAFDPQTQCNCTNCMNTIVLQSKVDNTGWPGYQYGDNNSFKLWFSGADNPLMCVGFVVQIDIGYGTPSPQLLAYHPTSSPVNTEVTVDVFGKDFLPSGDVSCSFSGSLVPANYIDSSHLNCSAPLSSTVNQTNFQVVDSGNILNGGSYDYYVDPVIIGISPTIGPSIGLTNVTITGSGFFNTTSDICKFGNIPVLDVLFIDDNTIVCIDVSDLKTTSPRDVPVYYSPNSNNYIQSPILFSFSGTDDNSVSDYYEDSIANDSLPLFAWAAIVVAFLIIIILIIGAISIYAQNKRKKNEPVGFSYSTYNEEESVNMDSIKGADGMALNVDPNSIPVTELKDLRQIEKGSFGVIYEATWRGTKIAVKKLPATMTDKQLTEFYQEAALMKSLRHPNILQYLGTSRSGREVCICMEFMPLGSLYRILHQNNSSFNRTRIKAICLDTVKGMNYLHHQHPPIVHRDLKSHNLLVNHHWQVKVCDFGLSRITAQNQTMTACGTPSWTAPEVLRNERYTTKADVYGFGIVIWEMFARADPFPGMPPFQIVFAVGNQKLRPKIDPSWPQEWVNLMTSCWNENPEDRPTFESIIKILERMKAP